ncbi:colicin immunity protein [Pseudomonas cichorii]|uniref:colicin immunity domain-containing protein n=1 Tax=Pseudomonas cichorii TaxID=36746 RepID=UPI001911077E|nr:colicin immunity domain-containing protein [Pseudomonas cichorii]GFM84102.1 colicin immunity protein [Pseudomonas cichorii]
MSLTVLEFAKSFLAGRVSAEIFSEAYMELWRIERDKGLVFEDSISLSECLSSIFCAADMYNPDESRDEYEFDDAKLRCEVAGLLRKFALD